MTVSNGMCTPSKMITGTHPWRTCQEGRTRRRCVLAMRRHARARARARVRACAAYRVINARRPPVAAGRNDAEHSVLHVRGVTCPAVADEAPTLGIAKRRVETPAHAARVPRRLIQAEIAREVRESTSRPVVDVASGVADGAEPFARRGEHWDHEIFRWRVARVRADERTRSARTEVPARPRRCADGFTPLCRPVIGHVSRT